MARSGESHMDSQQVEGTTLRDRPNGPAQGASAHSGQATALRNAGVFMAVVVGGFAIMLALTAMLAVVTFQLIVPVDAGALRVRAESASLAAIDALQRADFAGVEALLVNDFHEPIVAAYPAVAETTNALARAGASRPLLSGSGSCVFALFETEAAARTVAAAFDAATAEATYVVPLHRDTAWRG